MKKDDSSQIIKKFLRAKKILLVVIVEIVTIVANVCVAQGVSWEGVFKLQELFKMPSVLREEVSEITNSKLGRKIETEPNPKPKPAPQQPATKIVNTSDMSNYKLGWYIQRNSNHKLPQIPDKAKKLLKDTGAFYVGDTSQKAVYLTFDVGFVYDNSSKILDTLKEKNQKATFFITGAFLKGQKGLVQRMINEGHEVGNHTMSHLSMPGLSNGKFKAEINDLNKLFKAETGRNFVYFRPPYGEYSERTLHETNNLGLRTVFWSVCYDDYNVDKQRGTAYAYNMIMNNIHNGAVILLHTISKDNANVLGKLIDDLRAKGYSIELLGRGN